MIEHWVNRLTVDVEPPAEPPEGVGAELQWRLAVRLRGEHRVRPDPPAASDGSPAGPMCAGCGLRWPCSGWRLAELGLISALS